MPFPKNLHLLLTHAMLSENLGNGLSPLPKYLGTKLN